MRTPCVTCILGGNRVRRTSRTLQFARSRILGQGCSSQQWGKFLWKAVAKADGKPVEMNGKKCPQLTTSTISCLCPALFAVAWFVENVTTT